MDPSLQTDGVQLPAEAAGVPADLDALQNYVYGRIPPTLHVWSSVFKNVTAFTSLLGSSADLVLVLRSVFLPVAVSASVFTHNTGVTAHTSYSCFSRF